VQDLRGGGRQTNSTYQYTLKSDNAADLRVWATRLAEQMKLQDALTDVDTDQQENGVETMVTVDKESAARLGISSRDVDNALYNGFGQRQVATIYAELNQYHVIMEVAPRYTRSPESLKDIYVPAKNAAAARAPPPPAAHKHFIQYDHGTGTSGTAATTTDHGQHKHQQRQPGPARLSSGRF
jgi:multidrug efflux pump